MGRARSTSWACALRQIDAEQARTVKGNLTMLDKAFVDFHPSQQDLSGGLQYEVASYPSWA